MKYAQVVECIDKISQTKTNKSTDKNAATKIVAKVTGQNAELKHIFVSTSYGKSSIILFLSAILKEAGYKVGAYLTPNIPDSYRESILYRGKAISQAEFTALYEQICGASNEAEPDLTLEQLESAIGSLFFQKKQCDIVLWEIEPGIEKIEAPNVLLEITDEFTETAKKNITAVKHGKANKNGIGKQLFSYAPNYKNIELGQPGTFQIENAAVAIEAALQLGAFGFSYKEKSVRKAIAESSFQGRFEVLGKKPVFVLDGAERVAEAQRLCESMQQYFPEKKLICILGMKPENILDMASHQVLNPFLDSAEQVLTVTVSYRGQSLTAYELAEAIRETFPGVTAVDSPEEAVEIGRLLAGEDKIILAFGCANYFDKMRTAICNTGARQK